MSAISTFLSLFTPSVPHPNGLCLLPRPSEQKKQVKGTAPKKETGVYVINPDTHTYGFRGNGDTARTGAETWLTGFDKSELTARDLIGGGDVMRENTSVKYCPEWLRMDCLFE